MPRPLFWRRLYSPIVTTPSGFLRATGPDVLTGETITRWHVTFTVNAGVSARNLDNIYVFRDLLWGVRTSDPNVESAPNDFPGNFPAGNWKLIGHSMPELQYVSYGPASDPSPQTLLPYWRNQGDVSQAFGQERAGVLLRSWWLAGLGNQQTFPQNSVTGQVYFSLLIRGVFQP